MTTPLTTAGGLAAVAAFVAAVSPRYRRAAGWFALTAVGQGAALSMVVAGPFPRYQHYAPLRVLAADHPWLLGVLLLQATLVATSLARSLPALRALRDRGVPPWRLMLALGLSIVTAATVSADVSRYVAELAFAACVQLLAVATLGLMVASCPPSPMGGLELGVSRVLGSDDAPLTERRGGHAVAWTAGGVATVLAALLSILAYQRIPHVPDEVAYLHHAKYLAQGSLTMSLPPVPAAFDVDLMEYEATRWFSPVPPGWPAVLAVGAWAGVPWLVNPALAGINVLLAYVLIGHLYSRRVARGTAALLAISPWFLFLGMSFMTHQFTLTATLVAGVGVVQARRTGWWSWGLLAGAGVGVATLIRPLDGAIVGALIAAWSMGIGGVRLRLAPLFGLAVGTVLVAALVLPYNRMLTGDPLKFPINAYTDKHYAANANAYGFGADRGLGWPTDPNPGHGPTDGVINANLNTFGINTDLFGWFTGSLVLVTWLVCSGAWRRQDSVMMAAVLAFPLVYFPYYFSGGPDFGARYWFPVIVPLVALTVRGMQSLEGAAGSRVWLAVAAMSVMTLVTYVPWRAVDKYHDYRGMRADIRTLASEHKFGGDLVLVNGKRFPDYASAFTQNPVDLESHQTIYAWDRDSATRSLVLQVYADRRVWFVDGPSITGAGYRVAGGPVEARAVLSAIPK